MLDAADAQSFLLQHAAPTSVSYDGMFGAALGTIKQNIIDAHPGNILIGYDKRGVCRFAYDFNMTESHDDVIKAWADLAKSGSDMWFSILYSLFKFDTGEVISLRRLLAATVIVGCVGQYGSQQGFMGLVRNDGFVILLMALAKIEDGNPHFTFHYPQYPM